MPLFTYEALGEKGKKISGVIDADSYALAKERLRQQKILITKLSSQGKVKEISIDPSLLLAWTREIGQLLRAGLPLYESLLTMEEKYRQNKAHPILLDLCDGIKSGASFSFLLKKYPKSFDQIYLSLIEVGEQSGSFVYIFEQLSFLISRQQRLKKKLISSLMYPAFLGVFCFLLVLGLLFFVVPSMRELFEGRNLHPMTNFVLQISGAVNAHVGLFFSSIATLIVAPIFLARKKSVKAAFQKLLVKVPFFKDILIQSSLIRFCRASSVLLGGGVTLTDCLSLSRRTLKNASLEEAIENAEKKIIEGEKLSATLQKCPLFPSLVIRMLAIAEETGKMAPMMQNIADIYDEELERSLTQIATFLQPMILIFLGGIVGVVLLSILLPLTDVSSFISS